MTVKFQYTDNLGRNTEAEAYLASEFVNVAAPNAPVKTRSDGTIHPDMIPTTTLAKATKVVIVRKCSQPIAKGDLVSPFTSGYVQLSDSKLTLEEAYSLGVALQDGDAEDDIEILVFGIMVDTLFSVFAVHDLLFVDEDGAITNEKPDSTLGHKFQTPVGKALGGNEVFINVGMPTRIGV